MSDPLAVDFTSVAAASHRHDWADLDNVPADVADGDDGITTELDPTVNALARAMLSCAEGQIPVLVTGSWICGDDLVLDEAAVDGMVANNGFALAVDTDMVETEIVDARGAFGSLQARIDDQESRLGELEPGSVLYGLVELKDADDLAQLAGVQRVEGTVRVVASAFDDVSLPSLEYAKVIFIEANTTLANLSLPSLLSAGMISITGNTNLGTLDLSSLRIVAGDLSVNSTNAITTLTFPALEFVGGGLQINATSVQSLSLGPLRQVQGQLDFHDNSQLSSLNAPNLRTVGTNFNLLQDSSLVALSLPSLKRVNASFRISEQPLLTDVTTDISALAFVGGDFEVANNPNLPNCQAENLRDQVQSLETILGTIVISGNGAGVCN